MRPVHIRTLTVQSVTDITPGMRRVVLAGEAIHGYTAGGHDIPGVISEGFDDDVRLVFPDPATGELPDIQFNEAGSPIWQPPLTDLFRTYTVRAFDAAAGTMTIDFARHRAGLAEDWSKTAKPGDTLHVAGPKSSAPLPDKAEWMMFAGDDTALPAISRGVEELPEGMPAVVVVQIKDESHKQDLTSDENVVVHWVIDEDFGEACFGIDLPAGLSPETGYLWAAGEANALRKVRAFAKERGFAKENTEFVGYWRATNATADTITASDAADTAESTESTPAESSHEVFHRQATMLDITTGILVREAMALGVFEALTRRPLNTEQLAHATGTLPPDLRRLLLFLESVGMLTRTRKAPSEQAWDLTSLSTDLSDPDSYFALALLGPTWEQRLSLLNLADTLHARAGAAASPSYKDSAEGTASARAAEGFELRAQWWIPQLVASLKDMASSETIYVQAEHAGPVVEALTEAALQATSDVPNAAHQVLIDPLASGSNEQFRELLTESKKAGAKQIHVISVLLDPQELHDHDLVEDLSRMVRLDSQLPTLESLTEMARESGWTVAGQPVMLNWEMALVTLQ